MGSRLGFDAVIEINNTDPVDWDNPIWVEAGSVRDARLNWTVRSQEVTPWENQGFAQLATGLIRWVLDGDWIYDTTTDEWKKFLAHAQDGKKLDLRMLDNTSQQPLPPPPRDTTTGYRAWWVIRRLNKQESLGVIQTYALQLALAEHPANQAPQVVTIP